MIIIDNSNSSILPTRPSPLASPAVLAHSPKCFLAAKPSPEKAPNFPTTCAHLHFGDFAMNGHFGEEVHIVMIKRNLKQERRSRIAVRVEPHVGTMVGKVNMRSL